MAKASTWYTRQIHRWLGLLIGIQLLLWTASGLYFAFVDLDVVHGDHLLRPAPLVSGEVTLAAPATALRAIGAQEPVDSIAAISVGSSLDRPTYRIEYFTHDAAGVAARHTRMADALTGELRPRLSREEAVALARRAYIGPAEVTRVGYLEEVAPGHEYRGLPLPVWTVEFDAENRPTAYVAADLGEVIRIRHATWRIYDFLGMFHILDFRERDDFNNALLKAMSVLGLATVLSGFVLFGFTSPTLRALGRGRNDP